MNYEMKKIKTHWIANRFYVISIPIGWSFYPITYKDDKYVVELRCCTNVQRAEELKFVACIYEYGEENKLFRKHKRNRIFGDYVSSFSLDENKVLNIEHATDDEIKMYLPQVIASIFQRYELLEQQKGYISKKIIETENWNGVVK